MTVVTFQSATPATPPAGTAVTIDTDGAGGDLQVVTLGIPGSASRIPTDATNGLGVDVKRASGQAAAAAAAPAVFSVVAGYDGAAVRSLKTDTAGVLQVANASPLPAGGNSIGTVDTELPDAAALADAAANPTVPGVGSFGMLWNGATWDRAPGSTAGGVSQSPRADAVTAGTITANGQTVSATIAAGMSGWAAYVYGTYATGATLVWEVSPDGGTTWMGLNATLISQNQAAPVLQIALGANITTCYSADLPPGTTNIRIRCSAWAAPTGTINVRLSQSTSQHVLGYGSVAVTAITTNVVPGVAATSLGKAEDAAAVTGDTGVFALGVRNDTQSSPTNADGDYTQFSVDARGAVRVNPASFTYSHISTATTTTVKSGAGELHSISVNTKGTVASTITVYDNTAGSGTVIGVIDSLNLSGAFVLDVAFATGLTLVTTGTVAPDLTVSYR